MGHLGQHPSTAGSRSADIADGAITSDKFADEAIDAKAIGDGSVTTENSPMRP